MYNYICIFILRNWARNLEVVGEELEAFGLLGPLGAARPLLRIRCRLHTYVNTNQCRKHAKDLYLNTDQCQRYAAACEATDPKDGMPTLQKKHHFLGDST